MYIVHQLFIISLDVMGGCIFADKVVLQRDSYP